MEHLFDSHNHSQFSFDGKKTTIELSSASALEKGLKGITFTDHYDVFVPKTPEGTETIPSQYFDIIGQQKEIDRVRGLFGDNLKILKGIEIGVNVNSRKVVAQMMNEHDFDQVIASVHYLEDTDPYYGSFFIGKDWKQAYGEYLETIYTEISALGDFDIVGHYDYVARYAPYPPDSIRYRDFSDIFDAMFQYLITNGKGLEINTKSCAAGSRGRKTVIDLDVLMRYRELGGEIISLGSDSHVPEAVADGFAYHAQLLRSLGFRWTSHYEKRQLVQLPL